MLGQTKKSVLSCDCMFLVAAFYESSAAVDGRKKGRQAGADSKGF